jgi:hypothetical protein
MPNKNPEIGATIVITKSQLSTILNNLREQGFQLEGPQVKDFTVVLGPITSPDDLPRG